MSEEKSIFGELYDKIFGQSIPMWLGSILIAGMSVGLFVLASPFGASGAIQNWGDNLFNYSDNLTMHRYGIGALALLLGAMGAAFMAKQYSLRIAPPGELVKGAVGGIFMSFGAVLGQGCTLGSFFSGWAALSGGALVFAAGLAIGSFIAVKYLIWELNKYPGISSGGSEKNIVPKNIQPYIGIVLIALALVLPLLIGYDLDDKAQRAVVGFIVIFALIGIVLQRSRWCVVRALREPFMSGDSTAAVAIMSGILVGIAGMAAYKFSYGGDIAMVFVFPHFWIRALFGSILFGFGMTVAGGCAVGSMWRAAEGQVKLMVALISMMLVMPLVAKYVKPGFFELVPGTQVYMPELLGYGGAIALFVGIIGLWYWFVKWNDRTGKFAAI